MSLSEVSYTRLLAGLSPEQREVVDHWGSGLAVLAGAGAGKSTTLVIKCVQLLKLNPEARFAAVSFTEKSASDLRDKLSKHGVPLHPHWVTTIHGLCRLIVREFPGEAGVDGDERILSQLERDSLWEEVIDLLFSTDDLSPEVSAALDRLLERENRQPLLALISRALTIQSLGGDEALQDLGDPDASSLRSVLKWVSDRYERLKRRRGVLDFDDLERLAQRTLGSESVRRYFHARFDLVLVDEFQDTNPTQARILRQFVRGDASNLCVVGDPKQSIYRFRDADVSVFEDQCASLPRKISLTKNYRSRPGILNFVNQACAPVFEALEQKYEPLEPAREGDKGEDAVVRLRYQEPQELARWIKNQAASGVPLNDMALLLRKIRSSKIEPLLRALMQENIPLAIGSGGFFWEDPRVQEMTAFLKWWEDPENRLSGAIFLRSPWVGIKDSVLNEWIEGSRNLLDAFLETEHPVALAVRRYRGQVTQAGTLLLALMADAEIERELGFQCLGLWHRAEELAIQGMSFREIVREMGRAAEEKRRERDVPPPRNLGQLVILTLHGAKGLEFRHVILADFHGKERTAPAPLLFFDRKKGVFLAKRSEDRSRLKNDPIENEWRSMEAKKDVAESARVFYVALTRAQERLILAIPEDAPEEDSRDKILKQDNWRGWIGSLAIPDAPLIPERPPESPVQESFFNLLDEKNPQVTVRTQRARHSVTEWNLLQRCERAYEWRFIRPKWVRQNFVASLAKEENRLSLDMRSLGTRIHSCLETLDFEGLERLRPEWSSVDSLIAWAKESPWMKPSGQGREVWTELAFELPVDVEAATNVLVGAMDRVVRVDQDYAILDFKVNRSGKSGEELTAVYAHQMELYAWALGTLEPEARGRTKSILIQITQEGVREIEISLPPWGNFRTAATLERADRILQGEPGQPTPSYYCRLCDFRSICPQAQ